VTWSRTADRIYYVRDDLHSWTMAAALYQSDYRGAPLLALVSNAYSGEVVRAADSLLHAASVYVVTGKASWPLWRGMVSMDGSERPRGVAAGLRLLSDDHYADTVIVVPAMFSKGGGGPPIFS
jgi:hypothetical protein